MNSDQEVDFANEVGNLRGLMEDQNSKLDRVLEAGYGSCQSTAYIN